VIYAFRRSNLSAGPLWRFHVAKPGQCAICADGTVSSMAFGDGRLYAAGGSTTIGGTVYQGAVRALEPATGRVIWERGFPDPVIPALAFGAGFIVVADGPNLDILDATDGTVLFSQPTGSGTYAAPSIAGGEIVLGLLDGNLWVLAPK
jgi:outer membrane protein assembly factor BamB